MIFYTADLHFGHINSIKFCNRPFANITEMDTALIDNWNDVVTEKDTVYIIGDFAYRAAYSMKPVLATLKGKKHLIVGNHDKLWMKNLCLEDYFASVNDILEINDGQTQVTLCHYPLLKWNRMEHGTVHIHGHIHNNLEDSAVNILKNLNAYNAGVDVNNFRPVTLEQLKENKARFYNNI